MHPRTLPFPVLVQLYKHTMMVGDKEMVDSTNLLTTYFKFIVLVDMKYQKDADTIKPQLLQWFEKLFVYFGVAMQGVHIIPMPASLQLENTTIEKATKGILLFTDASSVQFGNRSVPLKNPFEFVVGEKIGLAKLPDIQHCAFTKDNTIKRKLKEIIEQAIQHGKGL